jgi:PAS domain S-box-containing protein
MKIGRKFTVSIISLVIVIGVLSALLYYNAAMSEEAERLESLGNTIGPLLEHSLDNYMLTRDSRALDDVLSHLRTVRPIRRIRLINSAGIVKASTNKEDVETRITERSAECQGCHEKGRRGLFLKKVNTFTWVQPVANKSECHRCHDPSVRNNGVFVIDFSTSGFERYARRDIVKESVIFIPSIGLIGLVIFLLSNGLIGRLTAVTEKIGRLKEGDYSVRIDRGGADEITELEDGFNEMAEAIHSREREKNLLFKQVSRAYLEWQYTFDSITELIAIIDEEFNIVRANRTFVEYFGSSSDDWRTGNCLDFLHAAEVTRADFPFKATIEEGRPVTAEISDPQGRTFEISTFPYTYPDADFRGAILVARNITERKRSEKIIKSNFDMQTVINSILKDAQEEIGLTDILQRAIGHILSLGWLSVRSMGSISLVGEEPNVLVMKAQKNLPEELLQTCARVRFGECICGRAASERAVQFMDHVDHRHEICGDNAGPHGHYCVPILYVDKTIGVLNLYLNEGTRLSNIEMDYFNAIAAALAGIIQHKRAEEDRERLILKLQDVLDMVSYSQKQWQDTFDSITDLVSIHDRDCTIIKANHAFASYFGLTPGEVINRKCYDFFHDGVRLPECPHEVALKEKRAVTEEIFEGMTGNIFRISTFPYRSPEGEIIGTVHIARDITDEKNNEMRLIMAERLASLGQMVAGIAHEINNPLAAIAGCTEGLLNRVKKERYDRELFENYLGIIVEEISRCKSITSGMLSVVRKSAHEKRDVDANAAIEKTLEIIGFQGRLQEVSVIKDFSDGLPPVRGSEGELRQIFMTVITNSLDAMRDKGTLTLGTKGTAESVLIEISDSGEGIAPGDINRVFDPFFTTKSNRGGTGLGLSIARKIVLDHNGTIAVSSQPDVVRRSELLFRSNPSRDIGSAGKLPSAADIIPDRIAVLLLVPVNFNVNINYLLWHRSCCHSEKHGA